MTPKNWLERTQLLIGDDGLQTLHQAHVMIVGLGGVGSFAAEFICRSGVGQMTVIDGDVVDPTNRNRQLPALATTHGMAKADLMGERLLSINPELKLHVIKKFILPDVVEELLIPAPDYIIDAIDSITPKLTLLTRSYQKQLPIVSSMGAGGKMDPTKLMVSDIAKTHTCPFAQQVRKMLKSEGIYSGIKAVFSTEAPDRDSLMMTDGKNFKKSSFGTISYLPAAFGAVTASVVIRDLINQ